MMMVNPNQKSVVIKVQCKNCLFAERKSKSKKIGYASHIVSFIFITSGVFGKIVIYNVKTEQKGNKLLPLLRKLCDNIL
jgi:hypothetical protein